MSKPGARTIYLCRECGAESPKWVGRCPQCSHWNSYVEEAAAPPAGKGVATGLTSPGPIELASVDLSPEPRISLPFRELDRVLGGGIVPGSLVLIGGDPGIGKSTLLLQMAQAVAEDRGPVLYVSGEESPQQVKVRARRLGIRGARLLLLAETDLERVLARLAETRPALAIVDSIQTMYLSGVPSTAGSVAQVRECALRLMQWAKATGTPIFLAGHVTKDGAIAGPRVLEHMVDVVLYLEGEAFSQFRVLRGVKNRFGSTNEVGIFEMGDAGLAEVANPSEAFLAHRGEAAQGSAIAATLEGTRPLLVEVQALVTPTASPAPRRIANGVDFNRVLLIAAVLSKHAGLSLGSQDILVSVVGGLRIAEPAADAAIALAIASSLRDTPVRPQCAAIGEVGLSGELRPVSQTDRRVAEAAALGFTSCVLPRAALGRLGAAPMSLRAAKQIELLGAATVREALRLGLEPRRRE